MSHHSASSGSVEHAGAANKRFVIMTCADAKYGDYLCDHWLKSLQANAGPGFAEVDVVAIDYGLDERQRAALRQHGVVLERAPRDGYPTNVRYRDMAKFLRQRGSHYEQVLSCDGGDIIFQRDITHLFVWEPDRYRAAVEPLQTHEFNASIFEMNGLSPALKSEFDRYTRGRAQINGGFIIAPRDAFLRLCDSVIELLAGRLADYASDQVIVNFLLRKEGFAQLAPIYNYVVLTNHGLRVRDGLFYSHDELVAVVHNAGGSDWIRSVEDFGFVGSPGTELEFAL